MTRVNSTIRTLATALTACLLCFTIAQAKKPDKPGGGGGAEYQIIPFLPPDIETRESYVTRLNDVGHAVGYAERTDGTYAPYHLDIDSNSYTALDGDGLAFGVNNLNQIVGRGDLGGLSLAVFWSDPSSGLVVLEPLPGDLEADALAINDAGMVVGRSWPDGPGFAPRGVVWRVIVNGNGEVQVNGPQELTPLAGDSISAAVDINEVIGVSAQAVGASYDGVLHEAIVWTISLNPNGTLAIPSTPQGLGTLGIDDPSESDGWAINNLGDACGQSDRMPFLAPAGELVQPLPVPRNTLSGGLFGSNYAADLNDQGDIVGKLGIKQKGSRAYLWRDGKPVDLNKNVPAGSDWDSLRFAGSINNTGVIGGWGLLASEPRGFLLIPANH